jgi:uncharacterized protein (TIGR03000 family)
VHSSRNTCLAILTAVASLSLTARPVQAQWGISRWGNPVISIGQTPYYANDAGQSVNFPGGYGYTPGYGYYPGNNIPGTTYPWLTGPDVPDYRKYPHGLPRPAPPPPPPSIDPAAAVVTMRVPDGADIWVLGVKTKQQGELRTFITPALEAGRIFTYDIQVRWKDAGQDVTRSREVNVRCGDRLTVDFLNNENTLPAPRKHNAP